MLFGLLFDTALLFVVVKFVTKSDEDVLKLLLLAFGITVAGVAMGMAGLHPLLVLAGYFVAVCVGLFLVANCSWLGALIAAAVFIVAKIAISWILGFLLSSSDDESAWLQRHEHAIVAVAVSSEAPRIPG